MTQPGPHALQPITIDARGLSCPLPVLRLNKTLKGISGPAEVVLLATDPAALRDVPAFCGAHGHEVIHSLAQSPQGEFFKFRIRKIA
ncbi:MAG: sulfurtransferase TusA family protein [Proteobacteria bacterium]|nr:sulfurtransferase TusA family protein [Pseudomonadota bacterium]